MEELQNMRTKMEQYIVSKDPALQKTMSVPEMRKLLGLKKTESYWLVHRNFFKTEIIGGVMRVDIESFEKWYANQVKHKKVNGEAPGRELTKTSYSFQEAANLLGVNNANLYEIWKREKRKTITVDFVMRILKEEFSCTIWRNKGYRNSHLCHRNRDQIKGTSINRRRSNDMTSSLADIE